MNNLQKIENLQKSKYVAKSGYLAKIQKKCANYDKLNIFETPLTRNEQIHLFENIFKICKTNFIEEKLKTCKINLKATVQNPLQNFLEIIVQSAIKRAIQIVKTNDWK